MAQMMMMQVGQAQHIEVEAMLVGVSDPAVATMGMAE